MKDFLLKMWRYGRWVLLTIVVLFFAIVLYRIPFVVEQEKTEETIAYIQSQKLVMEDVTGERLPPRPNQEFNDSTIEGIDANRNGIRDDVELAIFDKYSGDKNIKIRAAMLQYAMGLQMKLTEVFNSETWEVAVVQDSRGYFCISELYPRNEDNLDSYFEMVDKKQVEVEDLVFNSEEREDKKTNVKSFATSFSLPNSNFCDLQIE